METRQLRYFLAVCDEGTVSAAAARLGMAQPPLSYQIKNLERSLGLRLFDRVPRGMVLTAAGFQLLPEAREIIRRSAAAESALRDAGAGRVGRIAISVAGSVRSKRLSKRLRALINKHRAVRVSVEIASSLGAPPPGDLVIADDLDAVYLGTRRLFESRVLGVAFDRKHRLSDRVSLVPADLAGETILLQSPDQPTRSDQIIREGLVGSAHRFDVPTIHRPVDDCLWLASLGLGLAVCTRESAEAGAARVGWAPLVPALISLDTFVFADPGCRSAILPVLVDLLCD